MSKLQVDTIYAKDALNAPDFPAGATVTGVVTATTFKGGVTGNITGNITGNVVASGFSTFSNVEAVGIVTASSFKVGVGGTDIFSTIETKASTGKAIAMSMVFG